MNFYPYQFHYSLTGSRNKPVILFLHGFMGSSHDFSEIMSSLCEQFCCLAVDLPGHGKTQVMGGDECYTMPNTAQGLINLLNDLNIGKCFLTGYSMGGRLALYLTLHFSSRFEKVMLESSSPGLKTQQEQMQRRQSDWHRARELETGDFKLFLINWYNHPLFNSLKNHPDFGNILGSRLQNNPLNLAKSLRYLGTGNQPSLWEKLEQNQIPLLLLVGEYDDKFKATNAEIAKLCQDAQLKIIPKSGHNIHLENLTEYLAKLTDFFQHQEADALPI